MLHYIMIGDKIACSEQFSEEIAQFAVYSWEFVRKLHGWAILAVACRESHIF